MKMTKDIERILGRSLWDRCDIRSFNLAKARADSLHPLEGLSGGGGHIPLGMAGGLTDIVSETYFGDGGLDLESVEVINSQFEDWYNELPEPSQESD